MPLQYADFPLSGFSYSPAPRSGQGAYGMVPGDVTPPDPFKSLSGVPGFTGLGATNQNVSNVINAQLGGQISPGTLNALKTAAAQWGIGAGLGPNAGLTNNLLFGNIAGFAENQAQKGIENYNKTIPTVAGTQTISPDLAAQIAAYNATNRAAPDPTQAANAALDLFQKYLDKLGGGGGNKTYGGIAGVARSPGGGTQYSQPTTGAYDAPPPAAYGNPLGGINYGGTTYYGGATPTTGGGVLNFGTPSTTYPVYDTPYDYGSGSYGPWDYLPPTNTDWSVPTAGTGGSADSFTGTYGGGDTNPVFDPFADIFGLGG